MAEEKKRTRVGTGVFLIREGEIYLQQRKGSHGEGQWSLPGGKNEFMEPAIVAAARETREETGIEITDDDLHFITYNDDVWPELDMHYITLYFLAKSFKGEPKIMEPEKCTKSRWFPFAENDRVWWHEILDNLPRPLFNGTTNVIRRHNVELLELASHFGLLKEKVATTY